MQTVEEFDLESMKESLGDSTVELPDEINVHWQDYDSHWDCTISTSVLTAPVFRAAGQGLSIAVSADGQSVRCLTERFSILTTAATA